jgi:gluconolactonase
MILMTSRLRSRLRPRTQLRQIRARWQRLMQKSQRYYDHWRFTQISGICLEAHTPELLTLVPAEAKLIQLATGFELAQGPVWLPQQQRLLFTDILGNRIVQLTANQSTRIFRQSSHHANGLACDRQGRLIACEHGTRQVTRTELDGSITVLASQFQGKPLNSPNDVVVKSDGTIYFTDPLCGIHPSQQEQPHQGVYRLDQHSRELSLVVADMVVPNGLVFSPDEQTLYISDSDPTLQHVRAFAVQPDGSLTGGQVFCELKGDRPGLPNGMTCDYQGNLFFSGSGSVWVFSPIGHHLGTIHLPEIATNCSWGGVPTHLSNNNQRRSILRDPQFCLYITAGQSVYCLPCLTAPPYRTMHSPSSAPIRPHSTLPLSPLGLNTNQRAEHWL